MQKLIILLLLTFITLPAAADEKLKGYVLDEQKDPVTGANIYWEKSKIGVTSDSEGYFEIDHTQLHEHLIITYTGFITQSVHVEEKNKALKVILEEDKQLLEELVVSRRTPGTLTQRSAVAQTQKVTMGEIHRAACCNLGESFETNPSVDVAYSDAATGARQIKLLGLAGTYVQMLTENYPNFRGVASPYGMDYIPGAWMEGIYISKGTSSVKNGYEALAGQINVEYKKPQTMDHFSLNLFGSDAMRMEVNADAGIHLNEQLTTALFVHYSNDTQAHDRNEDGFLDYPKTKQFNLMNRWNHEAGKYVAQYGFKYINEQREGGQETHHHTLDDPYSIKLNTNRGEFYTKQAYVFRADELAESAAVIASGSIHDQQSQYDKTPYEVQQKNLYLSLLYEKDFSAMHNLSTGLSLNYDGFDETLQTSSFNRDETVTGAYAQYTFNLHNKLILLGGIRADHSSRYGFFITPRLHLKYNPYEWIHLRGSVGKGFRTANVLAENNYLLASSRRIEIADNLDQEEAWNAGVNATFYIPAGDREITLTGEWYHTRFMQQVVVDVDSDPHAISFYNLNEGRSYSNSAQVEMSYPFFTGFTLTAAYRYTHSMSDYRNQLSGETLFLTKPLMNDYKGLLTASYQTPLRKWQFDLTGQLNGGGRMPMAANTNPLWEEQFDPFMVVNGQVTKFFRNFSLYLGAENLFDFRQPDPIIDAVNPRSDNFDATMVWGPVHGRKIYAGLRYTIPRY
ncbi:MAG: TonB-dependent receptor [Bacteroidales bacterium]|jgi:outer membrane receptor for ferrienterochelin and colicin|nr:TonB-dependent receptor [Bacteroidales bacterium]